MRIADAMERSVSFHILVSQLCEDVFRVMKFWRNAVRVTSTDVTGTNESLSVGLLMTVSGYLGRLMNESVSGGQLRKF